MTIHTPHAAATASVEDQVVTPYAARVLAVLRYLEHGTDNHA